MECLGSTTGGMWTADETSDHINCLELKGATPGPRKQTSAGQGLISVTTEQERVRRADALVSRSAK